MSKREKSTLKIKKATRRRLRRRGNSFRHALSFCGVSCMHEEFHKKKKTTSALVRDGVRLHINKETKP